MIALAVPPQWRPAPHPTARAYAAKALKLGHYPWACAAERESEGARVGREQQTANGPLRARSGPRLTQADHSSAATAFTNRGPLRARSGPFAVCCSLPTRDRKSTRLN